MAKKKPRSNNFSRIMMAVLALIIILAMVLSTIRF